MEPLRSRMPRILSGLIIAFDELLIKKVHFRFIIFYSSISSSINMNAYSMAASR
jgi:hypothetical protein